MARDSQKAARKLQKRFAAIGTGVHKLTADEKADIKRSLKKKARESLTLDRKAFEAELKARELAKSQMGVKKIPA